MVVLPGKFLDRDYAQNTDIMYEYQYDTLFSSVQKGRLDGIIVAANCIGCYTTKERMVEFMHHYDGIPCVLVSSDLEEMCIRDRINSAADAHIRLYTAARSACCSVRSVTIWFFRRLRRQSSSD